MLRKNPEPSLISVEAVAISLASCRPAFPANNGANVNLVSDVPMGDPTSRSDAMSRSNADDRIEAESEELASHERLNSYMWVKFLDLTPNQVFIVVARFIRKG